MNYKIKKQFRYKNFDYSSDGAYFITICVQNMKYYFGNIKNKEMILSNIGKMAEKFWLEIPNHFKNVKLGVHQVMPNHIHGVLVIEHDTRTPMVSESKNAPWRVPTVDIRPLTKNSISSIINQFKGSVKRYCNKNNFEYFAWQPRFYDRIIRNEKEFEKIGQYILNNPINWGEDKYKIT